MDHELIYVNRIDGLFKDRYYQKNQNASQTTIPNQSVTHSTLSGPVSPIHTNHSVTTNPAQPASSASAQTAYQSQPSFYHNQSINPDQSQSLYYTPNSTMPHHPYYPTPYPPQPYMYQPPLNMNYSYNPYTPYSMPYQAPVPVRPPVSYIHS